MQLLQSRRPKRRSPWRIYIIVAVIAATAVGLWQSWDRMHNRYLRWRQDRALAQAREFFAKRDAPNAQLALDVAINTIPSRPEAYRMAADMLEQVGARSAMRLRRTVVELQPDSAADAAALVLSCIKFGDLNAARDALSNTPHDVSIQPPMLHAALTYALATGNTPVAEILFGELKSKLPNDQALELSRAVFHLRHPDPKQREAAKAELESLAKTQPAYTLSIERELAAYAMQLRDYSEARRRLQLVVADPAATLNDRLQLANLELLIEHEPFEKVFATLTPHAGKSPEDAAQFAQWLGIQGHPADADRWLGNLAPALRDTGVIRATQADIVAQLQDWDRLAPLLEAGAWGPVPQATIRLAFAAHTVDNPGRPSVRHDTWDMALDSAGGNLLALRALRRLAGIWQWEDETERTTWAIVRAFPDQTWAHQSLFDFYRQKKNAKGMRDVMAALRDADGSNQRFQGDWALLTMLLEPTALWNQAKDIAKQLYTAAPDNPTYATNYAFALAQAGKGPEALAVVEKLKPEERDYLPRQPYLAFVYGVAKKSAELEHAASLAQTLDALPEESYLFVRAREELNRKPEKPKPAPEAKTPAT